jgi:hypothetical protein
MLGDVGFVWGAASREACWEALEGSMDLKTDAYHFQAGQTRNSALRSPHRLVCADSISQGFASARTLTPWAEICTDPVVALARVILPVELRPSSSSSGRSSFEESVAIEGDLCKEGLRTGPR